MPTTTAVPPSLHTPTPTPPRTNPPRASTRASLLASLLVLATPLACSDVEGAQGQAAGGANTAGAAGGAGAAGERGGGGVDAAAGANVGGAPSPADKVCPANLPGPRMVKVLSADGAIAYCIDSTEVSEKDYVAFLDAKGDDVSGQREYCGWNKTFAPEQRVANGESSFACELGGTFDPKKPTNKPATCIDFCDAVAYCEWAGKRLCGRIGGGAAQGEEVSEPAWGQWANACSSGGRNKYPYGDSYEAGRCNLREGNLKRSTTDVGANPQCTTPSGALDLVGNVVEWQDSCSEYFPPSGSAVDHYCAIYGAGVDFSDDPAGFDCRWGGTTNPKNTLPGLGFRCCLD